MQQLSSRFRAEQLAEELLLKSKCSPDGRLRVWVEHLYDFAVVLQLFGTCQSLPHV